VPNDILLHSSALCIFPRNSSALEKKKKRPGLMYLSTSFGRHADTPDPKMGKGSSRFSSIAMSNAQFRPKSPLASPLGGQGFSTTGSINRHY